MASCQIDSLLRKAQSALTDDEVCTLIERYADAEAQQEFRAGRKVVIGLRLSTDGKAWPTGRYDDPMLVVWRHDDGSVSLRRFMGNTEPARIYGWGGPRQSRGSSVDLDGDGRADLGRLRAGSYRYEPVAGGVYLGNRAYRARDTQTVLRDVNQDGRFSLADGDMIDPARAGRSMLFHQGGLGNDSWSAGCQTISKRDYGRFLAALGKQDCFSYVLIDVDQAG